MAPGRPFTWLCLASVLLVALTARLGLVARRRALVSLAPLLLITAFSGKIDEGTSFDSTDFRSIVPRFTPEARKANQALVDLLRRIAEGKKATPAQIALAWLLAKKPWIVPIPGTRRLERLEENLRAAEVRLAPEDLGEIDRAAARITVHGARYPERLQKLIDR